MRIALAGASGTGKTTLMGKLAAKLDLPMLPGTSSLTLRATGFDNLYDADKASADVYDRVRNLLLSRNVEPEEASRLAARAAIGKEELPTSKSMRWRVQQELMFAKVTQETKHDTFITDRSVLDVVAYTMQHCLREVPPDFIKIAVAHTRSIYDVLIFVHPPTAREAFSFQAGDKKRVSDEQYHEMTHLLLRLLMPDERATPFVIEVERDADVDALVQTLRFFDRRVQDE